MQLVLTKEATEKEIHDFSIFCGASSLNTNANFKISVTLESATENCHSVVASIISVFVGLSLSRWNFWRTLSMDAERA